MQASLAGISVRGDSVKRVGLRLGALALNALTFAWVARSLGSSETGSWALATALTSIVMSFDLGLASHVRNLLALGPDRAEAVFMMAARLAMKLAALYAAALLATGTIALTLSPHAAARWALNPTLSWTLALATLMLLLRLPFNLATNAFYSFHESTLPMLWDFVNFGISFLFVVIALELGGGVAGAALAYLLGGNLAAAGAFAHLLHRRRWRLHLRGEPGEGSLLGGSWRFGTLQIIALGLNTLPAFVIGSLGRLQDVTIVRATMILCQTVLSLHLAHVMPLWTEFTALSHAPKSGQHSRLPGRLVGEALMLAAAFGALAVVAPTGIHLWLGIAAPDLVLTTTFCFWGWCCGVSNLYSLILNGGNRPLATALALVPGTLVAALASRPLAAAWGSIGVATAFAAGAMLTAALMVALAWNLIQSISRK